MINLFSALSESQGERQLNVVLAWLLEAVPGATTGLLSHLGIAISPLRKQVVEFQAGSSAVGFPDLVLRAISPSGESILVVIELKLEAELTPHQESGYAKYRAGQIADRSFFVLVGPDRHRLRYTSSISQIDDARFLSVENFIELLGSMGSALPLKAVADDLREYFLPAPIPRGQLQKDLARAGELDREERAQLPVRILAVQLRDALSDRHGGQLITGQVVWGRLNEADPWVGFLIRKDGEENGTIAVGFWLRTDLEEGVPFFFQTKSEVIAEKLKERGHALEPARFTKWGKFEWVPRFDLAEITLDGLLEHSGEFFADLASILADESGTDPESEPAE